MTNLHTPPTIDLLSLIGRDTKLRKVAGTRGGEWAGACPFCGGKDRFRVHPADNRWTCRQCEDFHWQDDIAYIRRRDNCTFQEALETLGRVSDWSAEQSLSREPQPAKPIEQWDENEKACMSPRWQDRAWSFIDECVHNLSNLAYGKRVYRDYLIKKRGLNHAVIESSFIGYNPEGRKERWGDVDVWLPEGIVIPWIDTSLFCWKVRFRTPKGDYPQAKGSANTLYYMGTPTPQSCVMMVEGELDANMLKAQCWRLGAGFIPVATGGTKGGRRLSLVAEIAIAAMTLLSFDVGDGDKAGDNAADWWQGMLGEKAFRHLPTQKDTGEMYQAGESLLEWVLSAIDTNLLPEVES